ncbi:methyltransferase domain-containing protein [Streptomyces jumonjinensis]|nr:methyltransferase domain-containing protein [Streptomyces jumonjinensis]
MDSRTSRAADRSVDPAAWYGCADADVPITVQWDDGDHHGASPGRVPTSSVSMPSVVASMLADLDVRPGQKVLEIGTGSGWNAGLLAHRLGDDRVVTVEVDKAVAGAARARLNRHGLHPTVVTGDGLLGFAAGAPYDRIIATVGLRRIPYSWVEQAVPGGLIVAPWGTAFGNTDHVVRLTVSEDGRAASGRLSTPVEFMKVRSQRRQVHQAAYLPDGFPGNATTGTTTLSAAGLGVENRMHHPFSTAAGLLVPDCVLMADRRGKSVSTWLYSLNDLSWAATVLTDGTTESTVYQSGPRRLWAELASAHRWWTENERPGPNRFGLTVTPGEETIWMDTPGNPLPRR